MTMINPNIIIASLFVGILIVILMLSTLFKHKFMEWDRNMSTNLKQFLSSHGPPQSENTEGEDGYSPMPSASYDVEVANPSGLILQKHHFICSGKTLDEAITGVTYLRDLAMEKFSNDVKQKKDDRYFGIG